MAEDNLLIYYAGHGWHDEDASRGYWLPVDSEQGAPSNWLSNATITDMLRAMHARHVMIIADSRYSGTPTSGIQMRPQSASETYLGKLASKRVRTAMKSGGLAPAEDGAGYNSVFVTDFAEAPRSNRGAIDLRRDPLARHSRGESYARLLRYPPCGTRRRGLPLVRREG